MNSLLLLLIALNVTVFLWMYKTGKYESQVSDETYSQHVESILKQGDTINTISIFNKGGQSEYAERNNQKTIDKYVSIGEIETVKINGNIIITVIKNRFTHLAICVFMVIFLFRVFQGEEYKSMQTMLYATRNGRKRLAIARWVLSCVSLMVFIILNYAVIFGCVYVIDGYKCSDLLAPIQSVVEFYDCVMKTSIIGYRILFQSNHSGKDLLVAAVICLLFCNGYAYDKRMRVKELIYSTRDGRNKIHRIRILVMTLLCGIAFALVYGLEFYEIQCVCPMRWWSAPVQSLSFFEGCRVNISLGFLVFLFEVSRFVMMVTLGILVYVLSYSRSSKEALIIPLAGAAIYIKIKSVANPAITITMSAIIIVFTVLGWIYVVRNRKLESKIR